MKCESTQPVPHGLDNDTVAALVTLYYLQDCPENFSIRISFSSLLKAMYLTDTGPNRALVLKSLDRLNAAKFRFQDAWKHEDSRVSLKSRFSIVDRVDDIRRMPEHQTIAGRDEHDLLIYLGSALAHSVNARQILTLRPAVLAELSSCVARSVYRTFEGIRIASSAPDELKKELLLDTAELAGYLRLLAPNGDIADSANVQRIIKPALTSLQTMGYLERVDTIGRGKMATLRLTFSGEANIVDMRSVAILETLGIFDETAFDLARTHSRDVIEAVRDYALEAPGIRSPSGFAIKKLTAGEGPNILRARKVKQARAVKTSAQRAEPQILPDEEPQVARSLEERVNEVHRTVSFLLKKRLNEDQYGQLRAWLIVQAEPEATARAVTTAAAAGELDAFASQLVQQLGVPIAVSL
ncbi:hypothetical protein [Deinococcus multiflagellatus]|uniref:Uncharacterized protein n=1 Tax=Deinococcus multiflagellatus TaxID=1656887 RepID=A0ABW1ZT31_9DEIO